jgi:DNA-binding PadR family transcriptional regulator
VSTTRLLVLGVVRIFQPVHGYDVRRELATWRAEEWANVAPGSIYNALKTLARDGMIEIVGTDQVGGRPERTSYKLTPEGEKEFQILLRRTLWNVEEPIDPLAPGLSFMWVVPRAEMIAILRHRIAVVHGKVKGLEFAIEQLSDPYSKDQVGEMLGLAAARAQAEIPWAEKLIARLERGEYTFADERKPDALRKAATTVKKRFGKHRPGARPGSAKKRA